MKATSSTETFQVVMNLQNEYSLWPKCKELPVGWSSKGISGCKQECLDYITGIYTQITPCEMPPVEETCPNQGMECCLENTT